MGDSAAVGPGPLSDAWLIRHIHAEHRRVYGAPRIHAELRMAHGAGSGRKWVERLMRQAGISGLVARKRGRTAIRVPGCQGRRGSRRALPAVAPNVLWTADITYLRTWEGWLDLAAVRTPSAR